MLVFASCGMEEADFPLKTDLSVEIHMNEFESSLYNYLSLSNKADKTRSNESFSMTPYTYEGDTVMYVVQFDNGWEVFSADPRYEMSIMKGGTGTFNLDEFHPNIKGYLEGIAQDIHTLRQNNIELPNDSSWNWMSPNFKDNDTRASSGEKPDYNNGKWVLIKIIDKGTDITDIPHITKTKWNQTYPWNEYIPYDPTGTYHRYVGCVGVAMGQFAYFLHHKTGKPTYLPTAGSYNASLKKYVFLGNEDNKNFYWETMALNSYASSTKSAALLLGYIASAIDTDFSNEKWTEGSPAKITVAVDKYLNPSTGENYKVVDADGTTSAKIRSQLNAGYPVLAGGRNNKDIGHIFLIDSYYKITHNYEYVYGWDGKTLSGNDPNLYNPDGTIAVYGIQKTTQEKSEQEYFRMNWGWGGSYDNVKSSTSVWAYAKTDSTSFSNNRTIVIK